MGDIDLSPLHGLWVTPSGLATAPMGTMQEANNIVFRKPGVLEPLPAKVQVKGQVWSDATYRTRRMFDARDSLMLAFAQNTNIPSIQQARWIDLQSGAVGVAIALYGGAISFDKGKLQAAYYPGVDGKNGRQYVTTNSNLLRFDTSSQGTAQRSGLPAPIGMISRTIDSSTDGRAYQTGEKANVRAIFKRTFDDNSTPEYTGAPSTICSNGDAFPGPSNQLIRIGWAAGLPEIEVQAGSELIVELYRTKTVDDDKEPGDRMFLVGTAVVDATAVANRFVDILDNKKNDELGEALYTNRGQEGIAAARLQSPRLADVTEYKGTLYGIVTEERHSLTFFVGTQWGILVSDDERANGIGQRQISNSSMVLGSPTCTVPIAEHFKGLVVGQLYEPTSGDAANFPAGTEILSIDVGGGTIDMDANAIATTVKSIQIFDQIEIDGTKFKVQRLFLQFQDYHASTAFKFDIQFTLPISFGGGVAASIQTGLGFTISRLHAGGSSFDDSDKFAVRATNGQAYAPKLEGLSGAFTTSTSSVEGNRIGWCAPDQPDHWPIDNRETIGNETVLRIIATAETMYAFTTAGRVYRISGFDSNLIVDVIMEATYLAGVDAVQTYGGAVYAWTNRGLMEIGDMGIRNLSVQLQRVLEKAYADAVETQRTDLFDFPQDIQIERFHGEIWLRIETDALGRGTYFFYNIQNDEWSECGIPMSALHYSYDRRAFVFFEAGGALDERLSRFLDVNNNTLKQNDASFKLNRMDGGEAAMLKQWREMVFLFQQGAADTVNFKVTTYTDVTVGSDENETEEEVTIDDNQPNPYTAFVGTGAGFATQFWLQFLIDQDDSEWALDGIVVRAELKTDRTGTAGDTSTFVEPG